jgi:hypothetical protein
MNYIDLLKTVYNKQKLEMCDDIGTCIMLSKTISKDISNNKVIRKVVDYLFYVEPKHYFYLLYFLIPRSNYLPKFVKVEKNEEKENPLVEKIKYVLGWSTKEYNYNSIIIEKLVLCDEKHWKEQLGISK